jgi:radical SAM protein with 4Fe4S-binding SPASM domain
MDIDQCITDIKSQFNIIDIINCDQYDPSSVDLYSRIKTLHRDSYDAQDRLIFSITEDFYKENSLAGLRLTSLLSIINDVNISNYFVCVVTTNPAIKDECQWLMDNVSSDSVSFHTYLCEGNYQRSTAENQTSYIKYQRIEHLDLVESLTAEQKRLLFESNSFCMIPWTSMMVSANSTVKPCCEFSKTVGDCSKNSLQEIWNSDSLRTIRKQLLSGNKIEGCSACYHKEQLGRDTLRKSINRRFINHIDKIKMTQDDGFLKEFNLNYLDSRFNNLCNLSCRSCGPYSSSSWYQPAVAIGKVDSTSKALRIAGKNNYDVFDQVMQHIDTLERIYFAGGEPMMIEQFYQLVEELDRRGRHEVELIYNINMTRSQLSGKSIFDVWKKFKNISIGASLDGELERGEYLRCGQQWSDVLAFRREMLDQRPDIDFYISATTSILNALHLPDFHRNWVDQGLIKPEDFNIQLLFSPDYLRVDRAPSYLKDQIRTRYRDHLAWLKPLDTVGRATYGFESILNQLDNNAEFDTVDFWNNITPLDQYYGVDLITAFPELASLPRV